MVNCPVWACVISGLAFNTNIAGGILCGARAKGKPLRSATGMLYGWWSTGGLSAGVTSLNCGVCIIIVIIIVNNNSSVKKMLVEFLCLMYLKFI